MAIYVTTSRKPAPGTRSLARWLARFLGGECENRGKRSLAEIVERAEAAGFKRLLFVYESHGNPSELSFYEEGWLSPVLKIKSVELPEKKAGRITPGEIRIVAEDAMGKKMAPLFAVENSEETDAVEMHLSRGAVVFELGGKKAAAIRLAGFGDVIESKRE
ncbi:putative Brix domain-containing ribosomal biogenesis protein [Candidatus Norongarragalina meridionalis]|nr:putative Brix domain-containing ribosomal biogenesis protein [Candidatus Norongarragalina meridionalis]